MISGQKIKRVLYLALLLFTSSSIECNAQEYELPESALEVFIRGDLNLSIEGFVKNNGGRGIQMENKKWCPPPGYYIEYRYLQLRYWFKVSSEIQQSHYWNRLRQMIVHDKFAQFRKFGYINRETFTLGECVTEAELMSSRSIQAAAAADSKQLNELGDKLQREFNRWSKMDNVRMPYNPHGIYNQMADAEKAIGQFKEHVQQALQSRELAGTINELRNKYYQKAGMQQGVEAQFAGQVGKAMGQGQTGTGSSTNNANGNGEVSEPAGSEGSGKGDGGGLFKISIGFSSWFNQLLTILTRVLGIEHLLKPILAIAYFIAPDIFDEIGSFFAKIQHALVPKGVDDFLNEVSSIIESIDKFYSAAMSAKNLLSDPQFDKLFKGDFAINLKELQVDQFIDGIDKGATLANKAGFINNRDLHQIQRITSISSSLNKDGIKAGLKNFAVDKSKELLKKTSIGSRLPFVEMENCFKSRSKDDCSKILTNRLIADIPAKYRISGNAFNDLVSKGDFKGAINVALTKDITKIPLGYRATVNDIIKGKISLTPEQLEEIADTVKEYSGNKELADAILSGHGATFIAESAAQMKKEMAKPLRDMNLSEDAIQHFLNNSNAALLPTITNGMGITDPEAVNLLMQGNLTSAMKKQVEQRLPKYDEDYFADMAQDMRNRVQSQLGIRILILKAIQHGGLPYNLTSLLNAQK